MKEHISHAAPLNLREAIDAVTLHAQSTHRLRDWQQEIGIILAAARAYSCKTCGGTGAVLKFSRVDDCPDCKAARTMANHE